MTTTARRDPSIPARTIPESKVKWLGGPIGTYRYAEHKGTEYAVDRHPSDPETYVAQAGEIIIAIERVEMIDGSRWPTTVYHRAFPVAPGTHAAEARKARKPVGEKPLRVWDRLAGLDAMQRREPLRMVSGPATSSVDQLMTLPASSDQERSALGGVLDMIRARPRAIIEAGGNEPPARSVAGIVAYLAERGVELSLTQGRLLARSRKPIRAELRDLIEQVRELIVAHLQGKPVMCGECAEPAVSIAFPDAPLCAAHLEVQR